MATESDDSRGRRLSESIYNQEEVTQPGMTIRCSPEVNIHTRPGACDGAADVDERVGKDDAGLTVVENRHDRCLRSANADLVESKNEKALDCDLRRIAVA